VAGTRGEGTAAGEEYPPQPRQMMHQPWPGLPRGRPPCRRTSRKRNVVTTTTPGVGGMPAWAYACGACVRAKENDGKSQRLSGKGSPSPSRRAGANLNPRLTLALVHARSPTMSRGGHSTASTAPQGREECPGDPRNQAVGPQRQGRGGERGRHRSQRGSHPLCRQNVSTRAQCDESLLTVGSASPQA
jgi:hypothetical protein